MDPHPVFIGEEIRRSMSYAQYAEEMARRAGDDPTGLPRDEAERIAFTQLNLHRSGRILRTWRPSRELAEALARIRTPQIWLAISEPWCGDSAQCLPQFSMLADANPMIDLRVLLRDSNPDVMDHFLTGGKRSIPVLVAFSEEGRVLFRWGPRPAAAQEVFDAAKAEGLEKPDILERLHLFYGRNRSEALDEELTALLASAGNGS